MSQESPNTIYLKDYQPASFLVDTVDLTFDLHADTTEVTAMMRLRRNGRNDAPLRLNGVDIELVSIRLDGQPLKKSAYSIEGEDLIVTGLNDTCCLETITRTKPAENTSLEGLYRSASALCTQCEAEGFRKITYYPDRPDVMARFSTKLIADKTEYPVLLSNGNAIERGDLSNNRHWVKWDDPYPKPAYLFALVAGDLACLQDNYTTKSGRQVDLRIYAEHHNAKKCDHAMAALKKAMAWDEAVYGLEYDLDIYMIVAVDDFNMGAMENKGLNVFNSKYVLADPQSATDDDYAGIESVIAHEYFHNWTGNRVTCRDWFQLSLKEGLTVFRDQEFSADTFSRPISRIQNVRGLRSGQFPEDAGPMAHPVRPASYIEINNFYTATIYNKGAEVIRMMHTLLGKQGFRKGMDLYFKRHDGQAVTTDDFVAAMADANQFDLEQFKLWYEQAGTPQLTLRGTYEPDQQRYHLSVEQTCADTPGQTNKKPFHMPLTVALFGTDGQALSVRIENADEQQHEHRLELKERLQVFVFDGVESPPIVSALRDFSAPVKVTVEREDHELAFLAANDNDPFNRWDAGQELATGVAFDLLKAVQHSQPMRLDPEFIESIESTLRGEQIDKALIAEALVLPTEAYLGEQLETVDVDGLHTVRQFMRQELGQQLKTTLEEKYQENASNAPYEFTPPDYGRRRLKNQCLSYLMESGTAEIRTRCLNQFINADNMTDALGAFQALSNAECNEREEAIEGFLSRWGKDSLSMDKWFAVQATSHLPGTLARVNELMNHSAFNMKNPNKVRALVAAFCFRNQLRFHDATGAGYEFLTDRVLELDAMNPQIAARLLGALGRWRKFDESRQTMMRKQLERVVNTSGLSRDTFEIASKTLGD